MSQELIRYNVVQKYVGGNAEWEYEAAEDGRFLFADSALERIAKLTAEVERQTNNFDNCREECKDLEAENTSLKAEVERLQHEWDDCEDRLAGFIRLTDHAAKERDEARAENTRLKALLEE